MNPYEAQRAGDDVSPLPRNRAGCLGTLLDGPLPGCRAGCLCGILGLLLWCVLLVIAALLEESEREELAAHGIDALLGLVVWVGLCGTVGFIAGTVIAAVQTTRR